MSVSLYVARYVYAKRASVMFYDDQLVGSNKFINFSHVVIWDTIFNTVFGCLLFVNVIKAFRILGYNKRFIQIISVLTDAIEDIVGFSVVFILVFFAFVASGNLLFGSKLKDYRSFLSTCGSLTNSFIGKNKLDTLVRASPNAAQFFYIAYIGCVIMTLMTIFVAILNKSISLVKSQATSAPPIFGIANVIQNVVRKTLTILGFSKRLVAKKIENYQELYIHPSEGFQTTNIVRLMRGILDNTFHPETHNQSKKNSEEAEKFYFEGENRVSETQTKISENLSDSILSKETVGRLQVRRSILKRIMGLRGYKEPAGKEFDNFDDILSLDMRNKRKHQAQKRILKKVVGVSALDTPHSGKSDPLAVNLLYL
ncbi:polycystin-2-like protein 2 [Saccostrea echinata]|uniref:polycystin-2-like protein 2 n=1 Tax=Saccostrea echinata TaxID=191078 RepID=UPI002A833526|nr:polycystin-2-like protein 2 [Saccostrea echinata]